MVLGTDEGGGQAALGGPWMEEFTPLLKSVDGSSLFQSAEKLTHCIFLKALVPDAFCF